MAALGQRSSPNSLILAQHGLHFALSVGASGAAGLCPRPVGIGCARPRGAPRSADAAQMEGGQGVFWPKLGYLLKDL